MRSRCRQGEDFLGEWHSGALRRQAAITGSSDPLETLNHFGSQLADVLEEGLLVVFVVRLFVGFHVVETAIDGLGKVFGHYGGDGLEPGVAAFSKVAACSSFADDNRTVHSRKEGEVAVVVFDGKELEKILFADGAAGAIGEVAAYPYYQFGKKWRTGKMRGDIAKYDHQ